MEASIIVDKKHRLSTEHDFVEDSGAETTDTITHQMKLEPQIKTEAFEVGIGLGLVSMAEAIAFDGSITSNVLHNSLPINKEEFILPDDPEPDSHHSANIDFTFVDLPSRSESDLILKFEPTDAYDVYNESDPLRLTEVGFSDSFEEASAFETCDQKPTLLESTISSEPILVTSISPSPANSMTSSPQFEPDVPKKALLVLERVDIEAPDEKPSAKCPYCIFHFSSTEKLLTHLPTHVQKDTAHPKCPVCRKNFVTMEVLLPHIRTHAYDRLSTKQVDRLKRFWGIHAVHGQAVVGKRLLKSDLLAPGTKCEYICLLCSEGYPTLDQLQVHRQEVHGQQVCNICNAKFSTLHQLEEHKLFHNSPKPFRCDDCEVEFSFESSLNSHVRKCLARSKKQQSKPTRKRNLDMLMSIRF